MTKPSLVSVCLPRAAALLVLFVTVVSLAFPANTFAQEAVVKRSFDVPSGDARPALRQFAQQAKQEIVFEVKDVAGITTRAVQGEMTPVEALDAMLANTGLVVSRDVKTGAFAVRRENEAEAKNVSRAIADSSDRPSKKTDSDSYTNDQGEQVLKLESYEVTGSRIRGVLGEVTIQPVSTYTSDELERLGVQSVTDLMRYVPQLAQPRYDTSLDSSAGNALQSQAGTGGLVSLGDGLRGIGPDTTLVLINGRRVSKLGAANDAGQGLYSLSSIPFGAIDRIEILKDGGSAVYGSDAIAGVVNVILKKNYYGTELATTYRTSDKTDTALSRIVLTSGIKSGPLRIDLAASWSEQNSLAPRDRDFSASLDRRRFGGNDDRSMVPGGPGVVTSIDGSPLPGLTTPIAAIPAHSVGKNLTIDDFAKSGPVPERYDAAQYISYGERNQHGFRLASIYSLLNNLETFASISYNKTVLRSPATPRTFGTNANPFVTLPATYPGNPFGVPVRLQRVFWEITPLLDSTFSTKDTDITIGSRGTIFRTWQYELTAQKTWSIYNASGSASGAGGSLSNNLVQAAINSPDPSRRPILLNNGMKTSPNSEELLRSMLTPSAAFSERPELYVYSLTTNGSLWTLPSGMIKASAGAEYIEDYSHFSFMPDDAGIRLGTRIGTNSSRNATAAYGEISIPLFGSAHRMRGVDTATVNISTRFDNYSDFANNVVSRAGVLYKPVKIVGLRASYSEGFKVPRLTQLYRPNFTTTVGTSTSPDPLRGGTPIGGPVTFVTGGNPTLTPEHSESVNYGFIGDVPGVKGLSLSIDYYDIKVRDRVGSLNTELLLRFYPEKVTRLPASEADKALAGTMQLKECHRLGRDWW